MFNSFLLLLMLFASYKDYKIYLNTSQTVQVWGFRALVNCCLGCLGKHILFNLVIKHFSYQVIKDMLIPGESQPLGFQILSQSLLTQHQVVLQSLQSLVQVGFIGGLHHICCILYFTHKLFEVCVNVIKTLGVLRQLSSDVLRANEDGLQVRPGPLHLKPDGDHLISCG